MSDLSEKDRHRPDFEKTYKKWRDRTLNPAQRSGSQSRDKFLLDIGLETEPIYSPLNLMDDNFDYETDLGFPGEYPFTRGIDPEGYRSRPWVIRAYSGFGEASRCNKRYKKLLEIGADEIVMAVDLPTQVGYDSDHIMAKGEVGKVGVAVDSLQDMELLFDGIPLNKLKRVSMLGNSFGPIALALFIALGEKQGLDTSEFVVDLQNDVLKEYVARGTYIFPIKPAVILATEVVGYCARHMPHWYPCTLCANHMNAAGAGSSKATAFAMSNGIHYLDHLLDKGYKIDDLAPLFSMFLDERADFFVAIANFRATRKVWAELMRERYKAQDNRSLALKITSYSHGGETLLEPVNNIVRIALSALSYVFGGVQFLYNASYDEVLGTPSEEAARVAIRTQQILAHELGITNTTDPLGGSYYLETLTKKIERQIKEEMKKVEAIGGTVAAIEKGYYVQHMNEGALRRQREYELGQRIAVGVNKYKIEQQPPLGAFRIDARNEAEQVTRLRQLKENRDSKKVKECLDAIRIASEEKNALVPPVLEAVRAYATVGEICSVWREVFGEYCASEYFPARG